MGEVFAALLSGAAGFEKLAVIKRIRPHLAQDSRFISLFLTEARVTASLSHPNICQVFELGEIDGEYYLAMEYLEGLPLSRCIRKRVGDWPGAATGRRYRAPGPRRAAECPPLSPAGPRHDRHRSSRHVTGQMCS